MMVFYFFSKFRGAAALGGSLSSPAIVDEHECTKDSLISCLFVSMFQLRLLVKWSWLALE